MRRLTLTFDNGPSADTTPLVLDELARRELSAYFCVVGRQIAKPGGADLVRRASSEGHIIVNHSMTHSEPLGLTTDPDHVAVEIEQTARLLEECGVTSEPPLFRPFGLGGQLGPHLLSIDASTHLSDHGYTLLLWNSVPRDWEDIDTWPRQALADVHEHQHTVLVLHDLGTGAMAHLADFLDQVDEAGVEVTLDLPESCVPMRAGVGAPALRDYVSALPG